MEKYNKKLLDKIHFPSDLRKLPKKQLTTLATELREETIVAVSVTGGHLGASLGVIELTVAIHYVFNTPSSSILAIIALYNSTSTSSCSCNILSSSF